MDGQMLEGASERASTYFWAYWDKLYIEDGLIFKTYKFMIPTSQQQKFLKDLHVGHLGEEKALLWAWDYV